MRMPFEPPTDDYCESIAMIDEQICDLISKRNEISGNNPGFPNLALISAWCRRHDLNEDLVRRVFATLYNERLLKPLVIPTGFRMFVPVLKSAKANDALYMIPYMRQYENASVVCVEIEVGVDVGNSRIEQSPQVELFISPTYECRPDRGHGQDRMIQREFVVVPPLPDDVTELEFRLDVKPRRFCQPQSRPLAVNELSISLK